jgi:hypothetical protein
MMAALVRVLEPLSDLPGKQQCFPNGKRSLLDPFGQPKPFDEFHDQGAGAIRFFQSAKRRNVGMIEQGKDFGLALEANHAVRIAGERLWEDFQRHVTAKARVPRAIHLTHPASANRAQDLVGSQPSSGGQGHLAILRRVYLQTPQEQSKQMRRHGIDPEIRNFRYVSHRTRSRGRLLETSREGFTGVLVPLLSLRPSHGPSGSI